jgi:FAD/FMN-containing dehydrogenase
MTDHSAALSALAAAIGASQVLTSAADLEPHLVEGRGLYRGSAIALLRPASTEEVARCVSLARQYGLPIVPHGGNTGLVGGGVPQAALVLSLQRMNRIRDVDPINMTLTADAGAILQQVQQAASEADCLFPLSLGAEGSCTIGGNLSTNAGGTQVLRYGNARELCLGLEVVLPDGRVLNDLNRLRKNNTGYDLRNLFIGAEGTLGIITGAVLKLYPRPKRRATAWIGLRSAQDGLVLFDRFRKIAGETLTGFEFIYGIVLEFVLRHTPGVQRPLGEAHANYVLVEMTSPDERAELGASMEAILGQAFEDDLIQDATVAASEAQSNALWFLRERMSETQKYEGGSIKHDVSVPVSRVADFLNVATAACEAAMPGIRVAAFGHFGDGNIHFNLSQPVGADKAAYLTHWQAFNRIVHDIVMEMGGSFSAEHGIGMLKREELKHYKDPVALDLMRAIKRAFDPADLMNPGKVVPEA